MSRFPVFDPLNNTTFQWLDRSLNDMCNSLERDARVAYRGLSHQITPHVDLYPVEGGLELKADFPGMNHEDIKVNLNGRTLTLSGERKTTLDNKGDGWHIAERKYGSFKRVIRLPFAPNAEETTAQFFNGVLTMNFTSPPEETGSDIMIENRN